MPPVERLPLKSTVTEDAKTFASASVTPIPKARAKNKTIMFFFITLPPLVIVGIIDLIAMFFVITSFVVERVGISNDIIIFRQMSRKNGA